MKITRENYALFFLDHIEGRLSEADRKELMRFLALHPDLKDELERFEVIPLPDDEDVVFHDKAFLKKWPDDADDAGQALRRSTGIAVEEQFFLRAGSKEGVVVDPEQYEMAFAAYVEGDLDAAGEAAVEVFAASDDRYNRELALMQQMKLSSDDTEVFPGKKGLKHHRIGMAKQRLWYATSAAAAVLLLAMVTFSLFPLRDVPQVAQETPVDGAVEQPGAVADASSPQQALIPPIPMQPQRPVTAASQTEEEKTLRLPETRHEAVPGHRDATTPVDDPGRLREQHPPHNMPRPLLAGRLERREATGMPERSKTVPHAPEARKEYLWLAYRDRSETLFVQEEEERRGARHEVSLAQLAMNQVGQTIGVDLQGTDGAAAGDRPGLLDLAGRGLSGLNNMLGQPVVVDGERRDDGTQVQFAIGDFFEVSRRGRK